MNREQVIQEIARRLVEYYQPERVYLFGSAARGDDRPDSDLDFCVVLPDSTRIKSGTIHKRLLDLGEAVDVFRIHHTEFERRLNWQASVPAAVRKEGRLLYGRDSGQN